MSILKEVSNTSCSSLEPHLGALFLHAPAVAAAAVFEMKNSSNKKKVSTENKSAGCQQGAPCCLLPVRGGGAARAARKNSQFVRTRERFCWFFFKKKMEKLKTHNEKAGSGGEKRGTTSRCR